MSASDTSRKRRLGIDAATRQQLVVLSRRPKARREQWTTKLPTDWNPGKVLNPHGEFVDHFTTATAWEFIASRLECGEEVEVIDLEKPQGKKGFVMKIDLEPGKPKLYVKLQLGAGRVFGRSFHYSTSR